jgi:hypothetical protein
VAEEPRRLINVQDMTLNQWLELTFDPSAGAMFTDYEFPTREHLQEYVDTIDQQ